MNGDPHHDACRQALARWRPDLPGAPDPEVAEALRRVAEDPELRAWWDRHQEFLTSTRTVLRALPPPPDLADRILAAHRTPPAGRRRLLLPRPVAWLAAAAAIVLGLFLTRVAISPPREEADFPTFRGRMVRAALREYRMDVVTNDLAAIRLFLSRQAAPAGFQLTPALAALQPVGGGLLGWQGRPVAMVCFQDANLRMHYLFIAPSDAFTRGTPGAVELLQVNKLGTASWTRGNLTYVLATTAPPEDLRRFTGSG